MFNILNYRDNLVNSKLDLIQYIYHTISNKFKSLIMAQFNQMRLETPIQPRRLSLKPGCHQNHVDSLFKAVIPELINQNNLESFV